MKTFHVGALVRCKGTFRDKETNDLVDPTVVLFKWRKPTAASTTTYTYGVGAELKKQSVGIYYVDLSITEAGVWHTGFYSTGTGQAVEEEMFRAQASQL